MKNNKLYNMLINSPRLIVSTPYAIKELGQKYFIICLKELIANNIVVSKVKYNYATVEASESFREYFKDEKFAMNLEKYMLNNRTTDECLTKTASGLRDMGIKRKGFVKQYNKLFRFDVDMLNKYKTQIIDDVVHKMASEMIKRGYIEYAEEFEYTYFDVVATIIGHYAEYDLQYSMNGCNTDSRGRAIPNALNKILNPMGYKLGRALMRVEPVVYTLDSISALNNIYCFISNEVGNKTDNLEDRIADGKRCYENRVIGDELYLNIWLERIYSKLDTLYACGSVEWDIVLESDFSMSLSTITALITNDERLLTWGNVINNDKLLDPWYIDGVDRPIAKLATATFYGSQEKLSSLYDRNFDEPRTTEIDKQLRLLKRELTKGRYGIITAMNTLLKESSMYHEVCNSKGEYTVSLGDYCEPFRVEVKKTKPIDSKKNDYFTIDSETGIMKYFNNTDVIVAKDYKQHQNFSYTCVIHSLDSILMDRIVSAIDDIEFALPVHDAVLSLPHVIDDVRTNAEIHMRDMHNQRKSILVNYLKSIGAEYSPKTPKLIRDLKKVIVEYDGNNKEFSGLCMK
jgi:hypothetical protein